MKLPLTVVLLAATLPISVRADSLKTQIAGSDKIVSRYLMAKDVQGFKNYMKGIVTPDFKHVENGKAMGLDAMCREMQQGLGMMKKMNRADMRIVGKQEHGDKVLIVTQHFMEGQIGGVSGKPVTMGFVGTTNDTWVKQGGKWKMSRMEWVKQTMLMNGKPMGAPMAPPKAKAH